MQNWKEPKTSTVYLANGGRLITAIDGISPEDGSGCVTLHGREIKVAPLPDTWSALGYGEIVSITLQNGEVIEAVLAPEAYQNHVAYLYRNESAEATICVFDEESLIWREMPDQEYKKERRAWSEDMKDMQQIKREWQEYRTEGDETPGAIVSTQDDISAALAGIRSRLDTLASINEHNILVHGGPQERCHQIIEEVYAALGLVETQVDELRTELEYQHKRLDDLRDAALAEIVQEEE